MAMESDQNGVLNDFGTHFLPLAQSLVVRRSIHAHKWTVTEPHIIAAIAWAVLLGGAGGLLTTIGPWYHNLVKPSWQPPNWLFGPAWTLILGLAAWAAILAWGGATNDTERLAIVIVYSVNFVCHFLWSPLFFTLKRPDWSLIEVVFLWSSVLAMCIVLRQFSVLASWLIVPYFIWVSFAAVLNLFIVKLNAPFGPAAEQRAAQSE